MWAGRGGVGGCGGNSALTGRALRACPGPVPVPTPGTHEHSVHAGGYDPSPGVLKLVLSPRTSPRWQLGVCLVLGTGSATGPQWAPQGHPGPCAGRPLGLAQVPQGSISCRLQQGLGQAGLSTAQRRETARGVQAVCPQPGFSPLCCLAVDLGIASCCLAALFTHQEAPRPLRELDDVERAFPELWLVAASSQGGNLGPGL